MSTNYRSLTLCLFLLPICFISGQAVEGSASSRELSFVYREGASYRVLSEVQQRITHNGQFSHNAYILNKIRISTRSVREGTGTLDAEFITSEEARSPEQAYQFANSYTVVYDRDRLGRMTVPPGAFVPTVRSVPTLAGRSVAPGESWAAKGSEVHDLRKGLGIAEPLEFPINVTYTYVGTETRAGVELAVIDAQYTIFHRFPRVRTGPGVPQQVSGYSNQKIYFNIAAGRPENYTEEYLIILGLSGNDNWQFEGNASARVVEANDLDTSKAARDLDKAIKDKALPNVTVKEDERGVTISIEDIQFLPNSATLVPSEREKLAKIADLLLAYPANDLLVTGHTALAGTEQGRKALSQERAQTVGNFLIDAGVKKKDQLLYQGLGATKPVADNTTEQGRARNRRVEITILKN